MLGLSHKKTTAISVFSLWFALGIFVIISKWDKSIADTKTRPFLNIILNIAILLSVVGIIWWSLVGEVLFPKIQGVVGRYQLLLVEGFSLVHDPSIPTPPELSPIWAVISLMIRDSLIFIPTLVGFLLISKDNLGKGDLSFNFVFSFSCAYFIVFSMLFFWAEPFRVLTYAAPFMMISMAKFYTNLKIVTNGKKARQFSSIILIAILSGSFISPHTHTHAPIYFYDEDLLVTEFGLPDKNSNGAILFALENSNNASSISSDHPDFSIHLVGLNDIQRFYAIFSDVSYIENDTLAYNPSTNIVLLLRGGNLFQMQSAQSTNSSFLDYTTKSKIAVLEKLTSEANLVYAQGDDVSIWVIPS